MENKQRSTAQKEADKRYKEKTKGKYKGIMVTLPAKEAEYHRDIMQSVGATPVQVWRAGIKTITGENDD